MEHTLLRELHMQRMVRQRGNAELMEQLALVVEVGGQQVKIYQRPGDTLGSHVWDCSIEVGVGRRHNGLVVGRDGARGGLGVFAFREQMCACNEHSLSLSQLARYLDVHLPELLEEKDPALEIGAGCGLVGIALAMKRGPCAAQVTITDRVGCSLLSLSLIVGSVFFVVLCCAVLCYAVLCCAVL
jgi:hypothetical protein